MEGAPRYTLLGAYTVYTVCTVYTVYTVQTALHCLNISKYGYIYIVKEGYNTIVRERWAVEQKVGVDWMDWMDGWLDLHILWIIS